MKKLLALIVLIGALRCAGTEAVQPDSRITEPMVLETIGFAGRTWVVKSGFCSTGNTTGPGPNYWCGDEEDLWVDAQGRLHLRINYKSALSAYGCVSIKTPVSGCGVYHYAVTDGPNGTPDTFDENVVLGLFTYETEAAYDNYEIDIEISDWGDPTPEANLWFVTWEDESSIHDDFLPTFGTGVVDHTFTWQPTAITFVSTKNNVLIGDGVRTGTEVYPCPSQPIYARINFWLQNGEAPASEQEVVIEDFEFTPFVLLSSPTGVTAVAAGEDTVELEWTDTSSGEGGTQVERKELGGAYSLIGTADPEAMEFEDTGLSAGTTYIYRLRTTGGGTHSDYSDEAQATTPGGADAGSEEPSLTSVDFSCVGWGGYVEGTIGDMPSGSWHVRTWIKSNKWWCQGEDLSPGQDGYFYATHGLWCTPGPGVDIYVALYDATADPWGTGDCETMELGEWPDGHDYLFGPFATL